MSQTSADSNNDDPKQVDFSQLEEGEYLSEVQYYQVIEVNQNAVKLRDQRGKESIVDQELVEAMYSANQYTKEVIVTRAELINIFTHSYNVVFTVNFNKQLKESDLTQKLVSVLSDLENIQGNSKQVKSLLKKTVKENLQGEERTLIGYLIQPESLLGRSKVIDLEIPSNKMQIRYVDHRTLNWLIVKNVKYIIKSSSKSSIKDSKKSSDSEKSESLMMGGIWIDDEKFIKFEEIAYLEVSASFDDLSDYFQNQDQGQEFSKLINLSEGETYYYSDIKMNNIKISVSDLDFGGWDYEKLHISQSSGMVKSGSWLYKLEDAIETGEVELSIFIYT